MPSLAIALGLASLVSSTAAHGYIRYISSVGGIRQAAQKTDLSLSVMRNVSLNTGFIGSNYISSSCLVCGCSNTPFNATDPPNGTNFALPAYAAGKTLSVAAGEQVQLIVSGTPGQGWPHPLGHLLAYLAYCGPGSTDCQSFDATTGQYFKILEWPHQGAGLSALTLAGAVQLTAPDASYDATVDGDPWNIKIPPTIKQGSYMLRAEIIDYLSASQTESYQNELYPFCAQLFVSGSGTVTPTTTVKFPDIYANDARINGGLANYVPGGPVFDSSNPAPASTNAIASPAASAAVSSGSSSSSSSSSSSNIGAIAGGAAGGGIAVLAAIGALWCMRRRKTKARNPPMDEVDETGFGDSYYAKPNSAVTTPYALPTAPFQAPEQPGREAIDSYYPVLTASGSPQMAMYNHAAPVVRHSVASSALPVSPEDAYTTSSRYSMQSGLTPTTPGFVLAMPPPPRSSHASTSTSVGPYRPTSYDDKSPAGPSTAVDEPPMVHEDAGPAPDDAVSPREELPPSYGAQRPH